MTRHMLLIDDNGPALLIHADTSDSDRADAIVAAEAFTDGEHGDEILRAGVYAFHVERDIVDTDTGEIGIVSYIGGRVDL